MRIRRYVASGVATLCAASALGAIVFSPAAVAGTTRGKNPPGSVRLPKSSVKRAGGIVCGKLHGRWVPGSALRSGYFVADAQQSRNFAALARHATRGAKKADLAQAALYSKRAKKRQPACTRTSAHPTQTPTSTSPSSPASPGFTGMPTPTPTPLRFNIGAATALALTDPTTMHGVRKNTTMIGQAPAGSNLQAVSASGGLSDAVSSGAASISHFFISPTGKLFVVFSTPVNINNTSSWPSPSSGCSLAQVDPSSGVPTCIDNSGSMIYWTGPGSASTQGIQFDNSGAIYYTGSAIGGGTFLRRYLNGVSTNLITDNVMLDHVLVMGDGSVFVSGRTLSTSASWTRRITPAGSLQPLEPTNSNFLASFSDNNVYMGLWSNSGVVRYMTASNAIDPESWIGQSGSMYFNASSICSAANQTWSNPFCGGGGGNVGWSYRAPNGNEFVTVGYSGQSSVAMQYFPTVGFLSTEVANVTVAQGVGNDLVLAGLNANHQNVLTFYDTTSASNPETELIGPGSQIEIYHLSYAASQNKLMFDGLRFADNRYVIGSVDLGTHQVSVVATSSVKWADLQTFG
jgi:hypothetical protein